MHMYESLVLHVGQGVLLPQTRVVRKTVRVEQDKEQAQAHGKGQVRVVVFGRQCATCLSPGGKREKATLYNEDVRKRDNP